MTHHRSSSLATLVVSAVFAALATGCTTASCPTASAMPCLTKRVCSKDVRGCETCACEAIPQSRPEQDQPGKRLTP